MTIEQVQLVRDKLVWILEEVAAIYGEVWGTVVESPLEVVMEHLEEALTGLEEEEERNNV